MAKTDTADTADTEGKSVTFVITNADGSDGGEQTLDAHLAPLLQPGQTAVLKVAKTSRPAAKASE